MLTLIPSAEEKLLSSSVLEFIGNHKASAERLTVLVPSLQTKDALQRELAHDFGLDVEVMLPANWLQNAWGLFGDGRQLVESSARTMLLRKLVSTGNYGMQATSGSLQFVAALCSRGVESVRVGDTDSEREVQIDALLAAYRSELERCGFIEAYEASSLLREQLAFDTQAESFIFVGFERLGSILEALVCLLASVRDCAFALREDCFAAHENAAYIRERLQLLAESTPFELLDGTAESEVGADASAASDTSATSATSAELQALSELIFNNESGEKLVPSGDVLEVKPSGPLAEAEAIFREAHTMLNEGCEQVLVVHPDPARIWRDLSQKLSATSLVGECDYSVSLTSLAQAAAFLGLATSVAELSTAAAQERASVGEGLKVNNWANPALDFADYREKTLGHSLDWWPPSSLSSFLLNEISGVRPSRAWRLDRTWRDNRGLTASQLLEQLQDQSQTSETCAAATEKLLVGDVQGALEAIRTRLAPDSSSAHVLMKLSRITEAMQADMQAFDYQLSATETVELFRELCERQNISQRLATSAEVCASIKLTDPLRAQNLDGRSYDGVIYLGLDTISSPIPASDGALAMLLDRLGVEPLHNKLLAAELSFSRIISLSRKKLVVGSTVFDSASNECYPALGLIELRACYVEVTKQDGDKVSAINALEAAAHSYEENNLTQTFAKSARLADGSAGELSAEELASLSEGDLAPYSKQILQQLFKSDDPLVLAPTALEAYLDCPRKFMATRLLKSQSVERGFGALEYGSFSHDVFQQLYTELIGKGMRVEEQTIESVKLSLQKYFAENLEKQLTLGKGSNPLISRSMVNDYGLSNLYLDLCGYLENEQNRFDGFRPLACEYEFGKEGSELPDFRFAGVRFSGKIDRIDVDDDAKQLIVIDYKRGGDTFLKNYSLRDGAYTNDTGPTPYDYDIPNKIQALIYVAALKKMVERGVGALADKKDYEVVASLYVALSPKNNSYQMTGAVSDDLPDAELDKKLWGGKKPNWQIQRRLHPYDVGLESFEQLLEESEEHIEAKVKELKEGNFAANPRTETVCNYCPLRNSCSKANVYDDDESGD